MGHTAPLSTLFYFSLSIQIMTIPKHTEARLTDFGNQTHNPVALAYNSTCTITRKRGNEGN